MKKITMIFTVLIAFCLVTTIAFAWYDSNYLNRKTWTISHGAGTSIVVPVNASNGFNTNTITVQGDCDDITVIANDDSTKRLYGFENVSSSTYGCGQVNTLMWAFLPSEQAYIYYNYAALGSAQANASGLCSEANMPYFYTFGAEGSSTWDFCNAQNMTLNGGATPSPDGHEGWGMAFDGANDYLENTNTFAWTTGDYSIEMWVYMTNQSNGKGLGCFGNTTGGESRVWCMKIQNGGNCNGRMGFLVRSATAEEFACSDTAAAQELNRWVHYVGTYNDTGGCGNFYVNGSLQSTKEDDACIGVGRSDTDRIHLGYGNGNEFMGFRIDSFKVYHKVLTAAEVNASYWASVNNGLHTFGAEESEVVKPVITIYEPTNTTELNNTEDLLFNVYDETDANVDCWYSLDGAANVSLGSVANNTNASAQLGYFDEGTHEVLSTCRDSTPSNISENRIFTMVWDNLTSETFFDSAYELSDQTFEMRLDTTSNITDVNANFTYNNTVYPADKFTVGSIYIFNATRTIPMVETNGTDITWYFNYSTDYNNGSTSIERQTTSRNQSIVWAYFPSGITSINRTLESEIQRVSFELANTSSAAVLGAWVKDEGIVHLGSIVNSTHATISYHILNISTLSQDRAAYGVLNVSYNGINYLRNTSNTSYSVWQMILSDCNDGNTTVSMILTHFNETNRADINATADVNFDVFASFGNFSRNYSFEFPSKQTRNICISPSWANMYTNAEIKYDSTGYTTRYYFLENTQISNSTLSVNMYSLNNTKSTITQVLVQYPDGAKINGAIVNVLRYYQGINSFITVASGRTNPDGVTNIFLEHNVIQYRFMVYQNGSLIYDDINARTVSGDTVLTVSEESLIGYFNWYRNVGWSCGLNSANSVFSCTIANGKNELRSASLEIDRKTVTGAWINNCTSINTSGTAEQSLILTCSLGNTTGNVYEWRLIGNFKNQRFYLDSGFIEGAESSTYGDYGLFITVFLLIAVALVGVWNPVVSVFLSIVLFVMMEVIGFTNAGMTGIGFLVVAGAIIIIKMRS